MPQPLSSPPKNIKLGAEVIDQRPTLAVHIARIATRWTYIENQQGVVLAKLLQSEADAVVAMYTALSGAASKAAILRAAANHHLPTDDYKKFERLLGATKGPQGGRNDVVHAVWAISDDYPNALLKAPQQDHLRWFAGHVTHSGGGVLPKGVDPQEIVRRHQEEMEAYDPRYWSWEEPDFIAVDNRIQDLAGKWGKAISWISGIRLRQSLGQ